MTHDFASIAGAAAIIAIPVAYGLLVLGALISVLRSRLEGGMKLVWCVFVFVAPFLGSLLWFFVGKKSTAVRSS
jgi:hypothetical protein